MEGNKMLKKCKDCEWTGPFGASTIIPYGLRTNKTNPAMEKFHSSLTNYIIVFYTKKRCVDCVEGYFWKKKCKGHPSMHGLKHWGFCVHYKRKWYKLWRPK